MKRKPAAKNPGAAALDKAVRAVAQRTAAGRSLSPRGLDPDDRVYHVLPEEGEDGMRTDPFLARALKVVAELPAGPAHAS